MLRKKNKNYRLLVRFIVICISVLAGCAISVAMLKRFFAKAPYFNITKVNVLGVEESLYSGFKRRLIGKNIFSQDLRALKTQIEQEEPDIKCISIQRIPPGEVVFILKRRLPLAQIKLVRFHLVDDEASILPQAQDLAFEKLPIIYCPADISKMLQGKRPYPAAELRSVIELLKEKNNLPALNDYAITKIHILTQRAHSFYLVENFTKEQSERNSSPLLPVEVRFDLDKPAETARVLALLLKKTPLSNIEYIDLKNVNSPVILERKEKGKRPTSAR
jgi:cell division septal protein FtsQ